MLAADLPTYAFERTAEQLPAGPRIFAKLIEMMLDPRTDIDSVADLLKRDAVLSARMLRVANSAAIGGQASGSISDLGEALQRIGISEVYRITGVAVTLQSANASLAYYGIGCRRMRETALHEALATEALCKHAGADHRAGYAAGLLRNYGRLLIDRVMQLYRPHGGKFEDSPFDSLVEWERDNFRTTGAVVAADLMTRWSFPEKVVSAVRHAAAVLPTRLKSREACLLHIAGRITHEKEFGLPGEATIWEDDPEIQRVAGIDLFGIEQASEDASTAFAEWRAVLD